MQLWYVQVYGEIVLVLLALYRAASSSPFLLLFLSTPRLKDPKEADPLMKVQNDLDDTKFVIVSGMYSLSVSPSLQLNHCHHLPPTITSPHHYLHLTHPSLTQCVPPFTCSMIPSKLFSDGERGWMTWLIRQTTLVSAPRHSTRR